MLNFACCVVHAVFFLVRRMPLAEVRRGARHRHAQAHLHRPPAARDTQHATCCDMQHATCCDMRYGVENQGEAAGKKSRQTTGMRQEGAGGSGRGRVLTCMVQSACTDTCGNRPKGRATHAFPLRQRRLDTPTNAFPLRTFPLSASPLLTHSHHRIPSCTFIPSEARVGRWRRISVCRTPFGGCMLHPA